MKNLRQQKINKVAFINNTKNKVSFDFEYTELDNTGLNINNINKSNIIKDYDFILILEDNEDEQRS